MSYARLHPKDAKGFRAFDHLIVNNGQRHPKHAAGVSRIDDPVIVPVKDRAPARAPALLSQVHERRRGRDSVVHPPLSAQTRGHGHQCPGHPARSGRRLLQEALI